MKRIVWLLGLLMFIVLVIPANADDDNKKITSHTFTYTDFKPYAWRPDVSEAIYTVAGFIIPANGNNFDHSASAILQSNCSITGFEMRHRGARAGDITLQIRYGNGGEMSVPTRAVVNALSSSGLRVYWDSPVNERMYLRKKLKYDPDIDGQLIVRVYGYTNGLGPTGIDWVKVICGPKKYGDDD